MLQTADLHTHSTASDGQHSPGTLVSMAEAAGIRVLALTDHDTLDGLDEAVAAGHARGLRVLRGVELSAREYPVFHILGYCFDAGETPLAALCRKMERRRRERGARILDYLRGKGVPLTLAEAEAEAGGNILGRPHFAKAMVRRGYAADVRDAFDRYLGTAEYYASVREEKPAVRECLDAIRGSGGVSSLAHPYQIGLDSDALEALVRRLAGFGLDAIECRYPLFTPEQTESYTRMAGKFGLQITGGSDFHGEAVKPGIGLAAWELELDWITERECPPERSTLWS